MSNVHLHQGEKLANGQGLLLQYCLNLLSRDSELCWFLFELLCCLAKTFARLRHKHIARRVQWMRCLQSGATVKLPSQIGDIREAPFPNKQEFPQHDETVLQMKDDEVEDGEIRPPDACTRVNAPNIQSTGNVRVATKGHSHSQSGDDLLNTTTEEECLVCDFGTGSACGFESSGYGKGYEPLPSGQSFFACSAELTGTAYADCVGFEYGRSNLRLAGGHTVSSLNEHRDGRRVCVCGGKAGWERATKRFRYLAPVPEDRCVFRLQSGLSGEYCNVKAEGSFDLDSLVLDVFEDDPVFDNTE